jgi:hypothetical protein
LDEKTENVLDFYGLVKTLPETVPIESIRIAKNALLSHDPPITPRDSVDSLTVRAIVDQIYKNKGVMFHELEPFERVVHCSQIIYSALSECKGISDFEDAKTVSTEDTKKLLDQFAGMTNLMPDSSKQEMMRIRITVKDPKEAGDKATVAYTTSDNPDKAQIMYLVKKDEKWLVQFSKDDAVSSGNKEESPDK